MIREAIGFGATIDEAKENAIEKLGAGELDDVQFDIITMPKKKVLGIFGGTDAQVKAFIEVPDEKKNSKKAQKQNVKKEKTVKASKKSEKVEVKVEEKTEIEVKSNQYNDFGEPVSESELAEDSPAKKAVEYIKTVLSALKCEGIEIKVASKENASLIILDGEDISILIGRRGETLEAMQYLASLAANNGGGHYKIALNIGSYREKREETLIALAKRISEQVLKTSKSRTLEHMNPYERRIIHTTVQAIDGVVSKSFGEGTQRRIVISKEGVPVRPPRIRENRRNGRNSNQRAKNNTVSSPAREPKKDTDIPLYGKIN